MVAQTNNRDMTDQSDRQDLEDRVEQLESTISKMLPSRRDALKLGGAALVGGAAMSGTASAQPGDQDGEAGVIGTDNDPVDIEASDIEVDDLVVNGTATGAFGGAPVLESGDSITVATLSLSTVNANFVTLYNGNAKDVLGGVIMGRGDNDFLYEFSSGQTLRKNGSGDSYSGNNSNFARDASPNIMETDFLPPAKDVTKIRVGTTLFQSENQFGAEVILRD